MNVLSQLKKDLRERVNDCRKDEKKWQRWPNYVFAQESQNYGDATAQVLDDIRELEKQKTKTKT